ncbi:MAG: pilus assembly protein TadG-related protein [Chloroflexota bacterium]|nr:pilus assembly protein TadG-related protein [Chloroflexota bacterium]
MSEQRKQNDGQTLVQVALMLVVLLGFLALAVDVGQVYLKRRQLQNAADAGALEGARQICFEDQTWAAAQGPATTVALTYATGAGIGFPTPASAYHMTVVVSQTIPSLAASVLGQSQFNPGARATAVCGGADRVCGLWPIGFSESQWLQLLDPSRPCGTPFYVWAGNNMNQDADCLIYDCDVDVDGIIDVLNSTGRSWLDFSDVVDDTYGETCAQSGCGTSELRCWILNDSAAQITIPACFAGDNGVRAAARSDVEARAGDQVSVPIFDYTGCPGISCPGGTTYHITGLGCIDVIGWIQQFELPRLDGGVPPWKDKVIVVSVSCTPCDTFCGSTSGTPPIPGGVNAVSLIE